MTYTFVVHNLNDSAKKKIKTLKHLYGVESNMALFNLMVEDVFEKKTENFKKNTNHSVKVKAKRRR